MKACFLIIAVFFSISSLFSQPVTILYHDGTGTIDLNDVSTQAESNRLIYYILHRALPERYGIDIKMKPVIWARGLELIESGVADGLMNASYNSERAAYAVYPMMNGLPDRGKMLKEIEYSLYKNVNSTVQWDGLSISGLDGELASVTSYAIVGDLEKMGHRVIEEMNIPSILRNVSIGRYSAAALLPEADIFLNDNQMISGNIIKIEPPLMRKEYHLIFSKSFYREKEELARKIWDAIEHYKGTEEYVKLKAELVN